MRTDIFSQFYHRVKCEDQSTFVNNYLPLMLDNHKHQKFVSPDWNMHTSYKADNLKNKIDWTEATEIYSKYVNEFLIQFFGHLPNWKIKGDIWYNAYGSNQTADIHDHLPDHFSIVHFLKFNPEVHNPIQFINPMESVVKHILTMSPSLKENINRFDQTQSLYTGRFMPIIEEGDIVIFPGSLPHGVPLSLSDEVRVTVAFNIDIVE